MKHSLLQDGPHRTQQSSERKRYPRCSGQNPSLTKGVIGFPTLQQNRGSFLKWFHLKECQTLYIAQNSIYSSPKGELSKRPYWHLDLLFQKVWNFKHEPWVTNHQSNLEQQTQLKWLYSALISIFPCQLKLERVKEGVDDHRLTVIILVSFHLQRKSVTHRNVGFNFQAVLSYTIYTP